MCLSHFLPWKILSPCTSSLCEVQVSSSIYVEDKTLKRSMQGSKPTVVSVNFALKCLMFCQDNLGKFKNTATCFFLPNKGADWKKSCHSYVFMFRAYLNSRDYNQADFINNITLWVWIGGVIVSQGQGMNCIDYLFILFKDVSWCIFWFIYKYNQQWCK